MNLEISLRDVIIFRDVRDKIFRLLFVPSSPPGKWGEKMKRGEEKFDEMTGRQLAISLRLPRILFRERERGGEVALVNVITGNC